MRQLKSNETKMALKNGLEKFLLALSGLFMGAILVLGIKVKDTDKKLQKIKNELASAPSADIMAENQKTMNYAREKIIDTVTKAPAKDVTVDTLTKTVIPGKIVPVKVEKSSGGSGSSSSSGSSGSSSKTTATS